MMQTQQFRTRVQLMTLGIVLAIASFNAVAQCPIPTPFQPITTQVQVETLPKEVQQTLGHSPAPAVAVGEKTLPHNSIQMVNFWAIWCAPCRKELPMLAKLKAQQQANSSISINTIHIGNTPAEKLRAIQTPLGAESLGQVSIDDFASLQDLGVMGLPATFIAINGEVRYQALGYLGEESAPLEQWMSCLAQAERKETTQKIIQKTRNAKE